MTAEQPDLDEIRKAKTYDRISAIGLVLVVGGFLLQLVGLYL